MTSAPTCAPPTLRFDAAGARFRCVGADGEADVALPLPGRFNVENALCAIAVAGALGVGLAEAAAALADADRVPGRFEPVDEGQPFAVLVDYAHTPDSLENVLASARQITAAGGAADLRLRLRRRPRPRQAPADGRDRRPARRPRGGHLRQPALRGPGGDHRRDPRRDRRRRSGPRSRSSPTAGRRSRSRSAAAAPGDTVVIAGKGHEQGQEFEHGRKIPFDDREVAGEELRALAGRPRRAT